MDITINTGQIEQTADLLTLDFKDRAGNWVLRFRDNAGHFRQTSLGKLHNNMTQRIKSPWHRSYANVRTSALFADPQKFCDWAVAQKGWGYGYQLDKDLLGDGKLYSEDTCTFLPREINGLLGTKLAYPVKAGKRWVVRTRHKGKATATYADTFEQAKERSRGVRKQYLRALADAYRDTIDPRAYEAIVAWEPKF